MTLYKFIQALQELSDKGYDDMEVKLLCCDDNPIKGEYASVNGAYIIANHPDEAVDGVYIDGTV